MTWKRYLLAFVITAAIFGTAFYIASRFNTERIADIQSIEESMSVNLLSSETQFELLGNLDCQNISQNPILSDELDSLASRLSVAEDNLGSDNGEVINLKEQYSLLEIRDYLLLEQVSQKCHFKPVYVLYFYSNAGDCPECSQAGEELTYLREQYPGLRVYSFDYNLDLSALKTLITLHSIHAPLPAFVINNRPAVYGFKTLEQLEALMPELKTLATSTSATSTAGF